MVPEKILYHYLIDTLKKLHNVATLDKTNEIIPQDRQYDKTLDAMKDKIDISIDEDF